MAHAAERQSGDAIAPQWHAPAPAARAATMALYAWRDPRTSMLIALGAALPAVIAALIAPALLTVSQTADLLAPIAEARAMASGAAPVAAVSSPFYLSLLLAADFFFEAPGRIHLGAKAIAALLAALAFASVAAARVSAAQAAVLTACLAAFVAAPFSGPAEASLALLMAVTASFICAPADDISRRAAVEGALAGAILVALWMSDAVLALFGVIALSACPFLSGGRGLIRYGCALAMACGLVALGEALLPGVSAARALSVSQTLASAFSTTGHARVFDSAALAVGCVLVIFIGFVFGGREHRRNAGAAIGFVFIAWAGARIAGADAAIVFVFAAGIAVFSTASPFYDGVFRAHDRASIAVSGAAGLLALTLGLAVIAQSTEQFVRQARAAGAAPAAIREAFAIVQEPEPTLARWIDEGRFASAEARALFPLAPADQSAMLLAAGERMRAFGAEGLEVSILTRGDIACVIAGRRDCSTDGKAAAARAKIVLVPRFDLDAGGGAFRGKSEALLYTEFRRVEQTAQWDVWVRRGTNLQTPFGTAQ